MRRAPAVAAALLIFSNAALAQGCMRSLDTILGGGVGSLPMAAQSYQKLYKVCVQTLALANVRDAFILLDGGIAVVPQRTGVLATAETLAGFCRMYPKGRLRFIIRGTLRQQPLAAAIVPLSSSDQPSCQRLLGHS